MIAMVAVFFLMIILFGLVGSARGWGKEVLVVASVILALAAITLIEDLLGNLGGLLGSQRMIFYERMLILTMLTYFGYQSPKVGRIARATERRAMIGERILSFFMGMISGYFVVGTYWYFATVANYPGLEKYINNNTPAEVAQTTVWVMDKLPPVWLDDPISVFIALVLVFVFVIIYFV